MKNIIRLAALTAALAAIFSCVKPDQGETGLNQNLTFTLKVMSVTGESARISVSHNGNETDTWYGFASPDTKTPIATLISEKIAELTAEGNITGLRKQSKLTINAGDLEPETDYIYITFGLTEKGTFYGVPASVEFTTGQDASKVTEVDTWKIQYQGRTEENGQQFENYAIQMDGKHRFYFTTVLKSVLEANEMTLEDYVKYEIAYTIPNYLRYYKVTEFTFNESVVISDYRKESGDYYGIAIGMKTDGTSTAEYSAAEFTIEEEEANADYTQWIGTWKISSKDKDTGKTRSYTIKVEHFDNNFLYAIEDWETNGDIDYDIDEYVGRYAIPAFYRNGNMEFQEYTIDFITFEDEGEYYFGLYGVGDVNYDGKNYTDQLGAFDGAPMGLAQTSDNGATGVINGLSVSDESLKIDYTGMGYAAYNPEDGDIVAWNAPMYFPISMTKQTSTFSAGGKAILHRRPLDEDRYNGKQNKPSVYMVR